MPIRNVYLNSEEEVSQTQQPKAWYQTIWGLVFLTVGLNVLSNAIYDKGRNHLRFLDQRRERQRNVDFLKKYENKTSTQAEQEVSLEEEKLDKEIN